MGTSMVIFVLWVRVRIMVRVKTLKTDMGEVGRKRGREKKSERERGAGPPRSG